MKFGKHWVADSVFMVITLLAVFGINLLLQELFNTQTMIPMIFLLGVFLVSWRTQGYFWGITASLISVLAVNYAFTYPYYAIDLISAFIDNIPYVATMIPVIAGIAVEMGIDSTALYFGLLSGATLGGNCTPIGASANITGIGILRKEGHEVANADFFKIGIPFTLSAIVPAYILVWVLFGA